MRLDDLTCLIPLYRSNPQLPRVFANIDSHIAAGAEVICSDEHGLDDAVDRIEHRYPRHPQVRILRPTGGGNWVSNCNRLISACRTPFFRIAPHDDSVEAESSAVLLAPLRLTPGIVLSHGWVRAETDTGTRLPERDEPRFPLRPIDDPLAFSAGLFWQGLFSGAFKAVIRRNVHDGGPLLIRPTATLKNAERAWLFGYSLLGDFAFSEAASMIKRYWSGSLTDGWKQTGADMIATAETMASYVDDFVPDAAARQALRFNLFLNAVRRANGIERLIAGHPPFEAPLPPAGPAAKALRPA